MDIKITLVYQLLSLTVLTQILTQPPTWIPSNYFQSGYSPVIITKTDSNTLPMPSHTFTFPSAFSTVPNLAYGTKQYAGYDTFFDQGFLVNSISLSPTQFQVSVQIMPNTYVLRFGVAYVAMDSQFPHHLNSFDNIPVNFSSALTNISAPTTSVRSFTQVIDYQVLAAGRTYTQFTIPKSDFKILLFTSTIRIAGSNGTAPVYWQVSWTIINTTHFSIKVNVDPYVKITILHFSMIIFNQKDVETGTGYRIIYQTWKTDASGGLYEFPSEFTNSFIMSLVSFGASIRSCGIFYNWQFQSSPQGVLLLASVVNPLANVGCSLNSMTSNIFYLKSWGCNPPFNYFNLTSQLCQKFCDNYYTQNSTAYTCVQCSYSCLDCTLTNTNLCTQCDQTIDHRILVDGSCICIDGTYENLVTSSVCQNCSNVISFCAKCQVVIGPDVVCTQCINDFSLRDGKNCLPCSNYHCLKCSTTSKQCLLCNQTQQYFLNPSTLECQICQLAFCVQCLNLNYCKNCDSSMYLGTNTFTGECEPCNVGCACDGYAPPSTLGLPCLSICGDGLIRVDEQCDDGNNIGKDGCSSTCSIEENWKCTGEPSCCIFVGAQTFELKKKSLYKNPSKNELTITFYLKPTNYFLTKIDLTKSISSNLTSSQIDYNSFSTYFDPISQTLTTVFTYLSNLQNQNAEFYFTMPKSPNCPSSPVVMQIVKLIDDGNKPIIVYQKEQYQSMQLIQKIMKPTLYASYILLFLSLLPAKIVGIELFGVLQLAFFSTANMDYVNLMLVPLMSMKQFNGYNGYNLQLPTNENDTNQKSVPSRISAVNYDANFLNNCNVQMGIIFLLIGVGLILYILSVCLFLCRISKKCLKIAKHILKQGLLTLILFNSLNIAYSVGLHFTYANFANRYYIDSISAIIALVLPVIILLSLLFASSEQFGEYKNKFKKDFASQSYFVVTILYRIGVGAYMATNNEISLSTLIIISFSLLFLMYNLVNLPFKDAYQNYRANVCHFCQFIILFIIMYYRSMKSSTPIQVSAKIYFPSFLLLSCLLLCIIISALCLVVQYYKFVKFIIKGISKLAGSLNHINGSKCIKEHSEIGLKQNSHQAILETNFQASEQTHQYRKQSDQFIN